MKKPDAFDEMVATAMDGYQWNARKRKSPVNLTAMAAKLLRKQHRKMVKRVRDMGREYMADTNSTKLNTYGKAISGAKAWALKDLAAALDKIAKGGKP